MIFVLTKDPCIANTFPKLSGALLTLVASDHLFLLRAQ